MKVGVNLLWLVPNEVGGTGAYTLRLLDALRRSGTAGLDVTLFVNAILRADDAHREMLDAFEVVVAPTSGDSRAARVVVESTWLRREAKARGIDLLHEAGGLVPILPTHRTLLTLHDLQPLTMPENFSLVKRSFMRAMVPRSVHAATRIATLTNFVAQDVADRLHVEASRFVRVPPGIDPPPAKTAADVEDLATRYRLHAADGAVRPFFLYPAITYPHKNHVLLVHAFATVCREHPEALLVLTGAAAQRESDVLAAAERLGIADNVRRTGRVPWRDVETFYQCATAMTWASRYEGCGIPVLEAMASGCPVIASDCTGITEMVGEAGLLVGPVDIDAWSTAMSLLLSDAQERSRLIAVGRRHADRFDWETSAKALVAAYEATAAA